MLSLPLGRDGPFGAKTGLLGSARGRVIEKEPDAINTMGLTEGEIPLRVLVCNLC